MIDGVPLLNIEPADYYRRFIVLKMLLVRAREAGQFDQAQRYG
jgi:hypothetical protein